MQPFSCQPRLLLQFAGPLRGLRGLLFFGGGLGPVHVLQQVALGLGLNCEAGHCLMMWGLGVVLLLLRGWALHLGLQVTVGLGLIWHWVMLWGLAVVHLLLRGWAVHLGLQVTVGLGLNWEAELCLRLWGLGVVLLLVRGWAVLLGVLVDLRVALVLGLLRGWAVGGSP